jgi:hypothetical protein
MPDHLTADFEDHFAYATQHGIDQEHRDLYAAMWERRPDLRGAPDELVATGCDLQRRWWRPIAGVLAGPPARLASGTAHRAAVCSAALPGLDDEGKRLYGDVAAYAAEHSVDFYSAFTGVTGRLDVERAEQREQPPLRQTHFADQASLAAFYKHAEELAARENIDLSDAVVVAEFDEKIAAARHDDGSSSVPWRDTSHPLRPRPWDDQDFERDVRRARTIGLDLRREEWEAAADEGQDLVYEEAARLHADRLDGLLDRRRTELEAAEAGEAARRKQLIDDELERRAKKRLEQ